MCVTIVVHEIIRDRIDDCPGDLCTTWPIEVSDRVSTMSPLERREVFTDLFDRRSGMSNEFGPGHAIATFRCEGPPDWSPESVTGQAL